MTAGKFSHVGKKLEKIKTILQEKLGRTASHNEWAVACKLTPMQLTIYSEMANSARNRLVQHNIRLVDFWARRLIEHSRGAREISYYELVTEGILGLTRAAEHYDGRGRFLQYAQPYIRHELYKGMTSLRPGSFLSHKSMMLCYQAYRARSKLHEVLQRVPTDLEVATFLKVSVDTLKGVLDDAKTKSTIISAQTNLGGVTGTNKGESFTTYLDLFLKADQTNFAVEKALWQVEFVQVLDCLNATERRTLCLRYGLTDGTARSIDRTAELMCATPEGVRKILLRAMDKLRNSPLAATLEEGPPLPPMETTNGRVGVMSY